MKFKFSNNTGQYYLKSLPYSTDTFRDRKVPVPYVWFSYAVVHVFVAMKIQINEPTKLLLEQDQNFVITRHGTFDVKGKGQVTTYWLLDGQFDRRY